MSRIQGLNSNGELLSSMYVEIPSRELFDLDCSDLPSLTRQEFAEECDINVLMSKYEASGILPSHMNKGIPQYIDVSEVPDLAQAFHAIETATNAFMALPASVRREFDNDPVKFVDFAQDSRNIDRMRELGLAPPAPPPAPTGASGAAGQGDSPAVTAPGEPASGSKSDSTK